MQLVTVGSRNVRDALNALPKTLLEPTTVQCASGTISGFQLVDFAGRDLYILGTFAASTLTSGSQTGTAGAGTTTTVMQKPTSAADWTANDLRKKLLRVLSGGGVSTTAIPTVRPIKSNTTTQLVVDAITGMDATTVFDIVDPATVLDADAASPLGSDTNSLLAECNTNRIRFVGFKLSVASKTYGSYTQFNRSIQFHGCHFAVAGTSNSFYSSDDREFAIFDSIMSNGAQGTVLGATKVNLSRIHANAAAGILVDDASTLTTVIDALSCTGNALTVKNVKKHSLGLVAASCAATPCVIEGCERTDITALSGTGNTGFGLDVSKGGVHNLNGASITGTLGDFTIDGLVHASVTWAASASYGAIVRWRTTLLITGNSNISQVLDTVRLEGNVDVPGNAYVSGTGGTYQGGGREIQYGYSHLAFTDSLTAHAGGGQGSAQALGLGFNVVTVCATNGDSVILPSGALAGGAIIPVLNLGAATLAVFPPVGGAINGGAPNASVSVATGKLAFLSSRNSAAGLDFAGGLTG